MAPHCPAGRDPSSPPTFIITATLERSDTTQRRQDRGNRDSLSLGDGQKSALYPAPCPLCWGLSPQPSQRGRRIRLHPAA